MGNMPCWGTLYQQNALCLFAVENLNHADGRHGDAGAGAEDGGNACLVEEIVVLGGDYAAGSHDDILAAQLLEFLDNLRHKSLVAGSQGGYAQNVHIILHGLAGSLGRSLEEGTHVDVETAVGISGGNHLGAAVVAVLAHFGNHDSGLAAFAAGEVFDHLLCADEVGIVLCFVGVHA